ncbi:Ig-like and fibronectin type-III domain-containing protein 2 [Halotydeus destructor]|nr:Ig-like and fibronectin type-III domain-containing protein 2 [Halotydeus destructor]
MVKLIVSAVLFSCLSLLVNTANGTPSLTGTSQEPIFTVVNEDIYFECRVQDLANYTVLWRFADLSKRDDGQVLTNGTSLVTDDTRFSLIHAEDDQMWILKLANVSHEDSGAYICELNTSPRLKTGRVLNVLDDSEETGNNSPPLLSSVDHNYTSCCSQEGVPLYCHGFCHFQGLVSQVQPQEAIRRCIQYLPSITKCLADGRNHMPCCKRQNIPETCQPVCVGNFSLATVLDHFTCMDYSAPVLACIAEGVMTLPPQPKEVNVEPVSSSELRISWKHADQGAHLIDMYQVNVTQLHSFDEAGLSLVARLERPDTSQEPSLYGLLLRFNILANRTELSVTDLKPYTMYQIDMIASNRMGASLPSDSIRTLTLEPVNDKAGNAAKKDSDGHPEPNLPDIKQCCRVANVPAGRCLDILCDPVKADEAILSDFMVCAPWANITFKCMAVGVDHSSCCQQRGVASNCMNFCKGDVERIDYRQFNCLAHMATYGSCVLDHHGVLPSPPKNFNVINVHHDWAILKWSPPTELAHTLIGYHVFWRDTAKDESSYSYYNVVDATTWPYLLDKLSPGGRYEVFVKAVNQYGLSQSSSRVIFSTPPLSWTEETETNELGSGYNETQCCVRASLEKNCMPLCTYRVKVTDVLTKASACANTLPILVKCATGGRNHVSCCRRLGVSADCLGLCAGHVETSANILASRCANDLGRMLQCMEQGTAIVEETPLDPQSSLATADSAHHQWGNRDMLMSFLVICFALCVLGATIGSSVYAYRRYYAAKRSAAGACISFENPSYMKDDASISVQFGPDNHNEVNANDLSKSSGN